MTKNVLILCTGNSCRSQMAEGLWRTIAGDAWAAFSAGSKPSGYVHPMAVQAMKLRGVDISMLQSKSLDQFVDTPFDLVVTVCDNAKDDCPVFVQAKRQVHWPFNDPADATGSDDEKLAVFVDIREQIERKITEFLSTDC